MRLVRVNGFRYRSPFLYMYCMCMHYCLKKMFFDDNAYLINSKIKKDCYFH